MQKWEFLRVTYTIVWEGGLRKGKFFPTVGVFRDGKQYELSGEEGEKWFNSIGEKGWELVSSSSPSGHAVRGGVSDHEILWFKRPK